MSKENKSYKPDWHPENAGKEFAVRVVKGTDSVGSKICFPSKEKTTYS